MKSPRMTHYRIPRAISIGVGSGSKSKDDSPQYSNAYGQDEWIDEDVGVDDVTDDLLQFEFHTGYV